jgi:ABC-2 type transport system ATP-binding protein
MNDKEVSMSENLALMAHGLYKSYGTVQALRGVELEVRQGEVFGFLGPNGAGKTTTIRCLLDLIRPDAGTLRVLGTDPQADPVAVQRQVGYLPGELQLNESWTGRHQLRYFNALRGDRADVAYVRQLADRLSLDLDKKIKNLSKGNKQKVGVVQALMHRPALLILDEPTSGLDPLVQQEVHRLIAGAREGGATVFFSSHVMSEVEAVAERVGIIRQGQVVEVAKTDGLIERSLRHVHVRFKQAVEADRLAQVPGVSLLSRDDGKGLTLQVQGDMEELVKALAQLPVRDLEIHRPSLNEVFLAYYS